MADLARRATRWVGTLSDGNVHVKFHDDRLRNGGDITYLEFRGNTFRWLMTLTFDLKYLSVTVYPYVICMPSFIMIGWEMAEILHFEILRKHGQTHKQTDMGITIPRPPPMGGEVTIWLPGVQMKDCDPTLLLSPLVNFSDEWGQIIIRYNFLVDKRVNLGNVLVNCGK